MKRLSLYIAIVLSVASCKKNNFAPCDDFEKFVGDWKSINADVVDFIEIKEKGKIKFVSSLERNRSYWITSCRKSVATFIHFEKEWEKQIFTVDDSEVLSTTIYYNKTFDTIMAGRGAFDHNDEDLTYLRQYVKVK